MKELLMARREQGKKGFTLMELLIVIAIIAILIAIAIPLFMAQLDSAKEASDEANARSLYALAMADYMDNQKYDNTGYDTINLNGKGTVKITVGDQENTFEFSDKTSSLTMSGNDTSASAPSISLTTNGTTYAFPGNTSGTAAP